MFLIYLTNTISHKKYIFLTISIHLKRLNTLPRTYYKSLSHERHMNINTKALLLKGTKTSYESHSY